MTKKTVQLVALIAAGYMGMAAKCGGNGSTEAQQNAGSTSTPNTNGSEDGTHGADGLKGGDTNHGVDKTAVGNAATGTGDHATDGTAHPEGGKYNSGEPEKGAGPK